MFITLHDEKNRPLHNIPVNSSNQEEVFDQLRQSIEHYEDMVLQEEIEAYTNNGDNFITEAVEDADHIIEDEAHIKIEPKVVVEGLYPTAVGGKAYKYRCTICNSKPLFCPGMLKHLETKHNIEYPLPLIDLAVDLYEKEK